MAVDQTRKYIKTPFGVLAPEHRTHFAYSDGATEERYLCQVLQQAKDRGSLST